MLIIGNNGRMTFDVVVVGSANLDLVARSTRLPNPGETVIGTHFFEACGGKGVNQAIAASRAGATTAFVGALGNDHAGETLRAALTNDRVDTSALQIVSAPTGRALIGVSNDGENSIIVVPGANHLLTSGDIDRNAQLLLSAKVLLCQLEIPLEAVRRALQISEPNAIRILNPAPAQILDRELLQLVDVIIPNEHEIKMLGGASQLRQFGVKTIVVTQGARGAVLITSAGERQIPPLGVNSVDSTGAGDAFCGMLAACLSKGESMDFALKASIVAGALATLVEGAVPSLPMWNMVKTKLESM